MTRIWIVVGLFLLLGTTQALAQSPCGCETAAASLPPCTTEPQPYQVGDIVVLEDNKAVDQSSARGYQLDPLPLPAWDPAYREEYTENIIAGLGVGSLLGAIFGLSGLMRRRYTRLQPSKMFILPIWNFSTFYENSRLTHAPVTLHDSSARMARTRFSFAFSYRYFFGSSGQGGACAYQP